MVSNFESSVDRKPLNFAIIGGGLGGLSLALCLLRHKVPIHIYEAAPSFGEIGAGIMFGPHAIHALSLISPDALAAFHKFVTHNKDDSVDMKWAWPPFLYGTDSQNGDGKVMGDLIWQVFPDEEVKVRSALNGTRTMSSVHRARFLEEMVKLIPQGIASFGKSLERVEETEDGVVMYFADGTTALGDAVIGCDGIKSKVRASIMSVEPQYAGGYVYRSLLDTEVATAILGEKLATNATLWAGYGGYAINYPVEKGRLVNVVACIEDVDTSKEHSIEQLVIPRSREEMYNDWKIWDPRFQALMREFKSSDRWDLWHLPHGEKYHKGKICLLGDSAHAAVPHLGSGAGMAIEDAYILGNLMASIKNVGGIEKAFAAYDHVRRPRTQKLVAKSKEAGTKHAFMLEGVGDNCEALQAYAQAQYRWIWNYNIEKSLAEAQTISKSA